MKAVNAVSFLTSSQPTSGTQPAAVSFRQSTGDGQAAQGFSGQLASLSSAQPKQDDAASGQSQSETSSQPLDQQESLQPVETTGQEKTEALPELAEVAKQAQATSTGDLPVSEQSATTSALTELVRSYQSLVRGTQSANVTAGTRGQTPTLTASQSQSIGQEYQRLMATVTQNLSASDLKGLDSVRADALKAAIQSGGSSSGAQIGAQSLLDNRPDLMTAGQRTPTVSEWAPIKLATQQPQHWGRDLMAALGDRLSMQVHQNIKEARIRLDPPELGRIEMTVRLDGDRLNIQLNASQHQVRDLLAQHVDRLRADLLAQNHQSVDVHVGHQNDQRHSRPGDDRDEILDNNLFAAETSDALMTGPTDNSWLSTKA